MTREEYLEFCTRCKNQKFNSQKGIVCKLNDEIASFENVCPNFVIDQNVKIKYDDKVELDEHEIQNRLPPELFEKLRLEQNFNAAIIYGFLAAILGAILWAFITIELNYQHTFIAIIIGIMVGFAVRKTGRGFENKFKIAGAAIAFFGVLLGNLLAIIGLASVELEMGFFETMTLIDYFELIKFYIFEVFDFYDALFYMAAVITGFQLSGMPITRKSIVDIKSNQ